MKLMTATEASRSFSAVLDEVEAGETIVITRGGERIAEMSPASRANGAAFLELLSTAPADDTWAEDIESALAFIDPPRIPRDPWQE